jgi:hypothetical protein
MGKMKVRNTESCYGCTETIYDIVSIDAFCDEVADNLFKVPALEKIQEMISNDQYTDEDLQNELEEQYRNDFKSALEILDSEPETLEELLKMMKRNDEAILEWDSLPTFGGVEPDSTLGVWSWDEKNMIVGTCANDVEIVDRNY